MRRASRSLPLGSLSPTDKRLVEILLGRGDLSPEGACRAIREKAAGSALPFALLLLEGHVKPDRLDEALRLLTEDYEDIVRLGGEALRRGSPARAIAFYSQAISRHGRDHESYRARGIAHLLIGQIDLALADLDRALALDDRTPETHHARALVFLRMGKNDEALAALDRAIELAPSAKAHVDRGLLRQAAGDLESAAEDYAQALRLDPRSPRAAYLLGVTHYLRGRHADAAANFATVLASVPFDAAMAKNARAIVAHLVRTGLVSKESLDLRVSFDFWPRSQETSGIRRTVSCGRPETSRPRWARPAAAGVLVALAALLASAVLLPRHETGEPSLPVANRTPPGPRSGPAPRAHRDLEKAVEAAIAAVRAGDIPASSQDSETFSGLDYDLLVDQGIYTREEADLQRELDRALVARSLAQKSVGERGPGDER
ncbi:MAG: tetratricopeptide repeat protein [Planctomycetes bacterium]|nr:tetratricopeptide repeat protein [Planctomycetota bacterium]